MTILEKYFLDPILSNGWFNPVNTIVYSIFLVIGVYYVYRLLKGREIVIDRKFFYAILPFILWASSTRVLHDAAFLGKLPTEGLNSFYSLPIFPTPGSYILTFLFAFLSLCIGMLLQKKLKVPYWKTMLSIGTFFTIINFAILLFIGMSAIPLGLVLGFTLLWSGLIFLAYKSSDIIKWKDYSSHIKEILTRNNQVILLGHIIDASATFTSLVFFGYVEQHVLPRLLFPYFGIVSMFALKIVVVIPVLYIIDRYGGEDRNFVNFLKIVVFILGFAPGLRDLLRLMAGV